MSFFTMASYPSFEDISDFGQGSEALTSDFFDQFLTFEKEATEDISESPFSYSGTSTNNSKSGSTSTSLTIDEKESLAMARWAAASVSSSASSHFYSERSGRAAISDSELLSLEGISLHSPQISSHCQRSLPTSPTLAAATLPRKKVSTNHIPTKTLRRVTGSVDKARIQSSVRKVPSKPRMQTAHQSQKSLDYWEQRLQHGSSRVQPTFQQNSRGLTPPLTCRISDVELNSQNFSSKTETGNSFTKNGTILHRTTGSANYQTPLNTPSLQHSRNTSSQHPGSTSPSYPVTPQDRNMTGSWSHLPGSPPSKMYRTTRAQVATEQPLFWNHTASIRMAQPAPSSYHTDPQRATRSLATQLQSSLSYESSELDRNPLGLMIRMPSKSYQSYPLGTPILESPLMQRGYAPAARPQPHYQTLQKQHTASPAGEASSGSPIRKAFSAWNESGSSTPSSPSDFTLQVRKRKSPRKNKKSQAPQPPSLGGPVDFVNYTPSDSRKILTGVAPSGSSKTKARREKEALEKRRKLSQAAVRAVRAAGGDIEYLLEEGVLV